MAHIDKNSKSTSLYVSCHHWWEHTGCALPLVVHYAKNGTTSEAMDTGAGGILSLMFSDALQE